MLPQPSTSTSGSCRRLPALPASAPGGKGFIPPGAGKRTVTRWINALEELEQAGLIRPTNPGGRLFQVTPEGEAAADRLKAEDQRQPG